MTISGRRIARLSLSGLLVGICLAQPLAAQAPRPAAPAAVAPTVVPTTPPSGFVLGPEDVLGIMFWKDEQMTGDVTVRPDGRIALPLVGEVQAAGLTPEALRSNIQTAARQYVVDANVTVVVRQINSRKVFVTGNVATPGAYPLVGPRTVMQAIALAGGLTEYADREHITILRIEGTTTKSFKFNYKDVSKGKKLEQNIALLPGDTIAVP